MVRGGVRDGLHRGALLPRRQARDRLPRAPRVARRARPRARTAEYLVRGVQRRRSRAACCRTRNAGILSRRRDGAAARRWNASLGPDARDDEPAPAREGHGAPLRARQGSRGAPAHARGGGRAARSRSRAGSCSGSARTTAERVDTLLAIRALADRYGHIQEVIVQPFHPKPGTRDARASRRSRTRRSRAGSRSRASCSGPTMNVQAPPNLAPDALELLLRAGVNDWGGVSPRDGRLHQPRGAVADAARAARAAPRRPAQRLVERLPVYPEHLRATRTSSSRACARPRCAGPARTATLVPAAGLEAA